MVALWISRIRSEYQGILSEKTVSNNITRNRDKLTMDDSPEGPDHLFAEAMVKKTLDSNTGTYIT
jgi:hypothetical protein